MADFNFYLNRQGLRGIQGPKGDTGFSPTVEVGKNTDKEFTLIITNDTGSIETDNIKEGLVPEDKGGTYLRKDTDTGKGVWATADAATTSSMGEVRFATSTDLRNGETGLAVESGAASDYFAVKADVTSLQNQLNSHTEQALTRFSMDESQIAENKTNIETLQTDVSTIQENMQEKLTAVEPVNISSDNKLSINTATVDSMGILKPDGTTITIDSNGVISATATTPDIATTDTAGIVKPDGTTISITDDGTITAIAGSGDVTQAGNNTFTGSNSFLGGSSFRVRNANGSLSSFITYENSDSGVGLPNGSTVLNYLHIGNFNNAAELTNKAFQATYDSEGNASYGFVLNQNTVTAGDNITVTKSDTGIIISSAASGGGTVINDSSGNELTEVTLGDNLQVTDNVLNVNLNEIGSDISALSTRVTTAEWVIDDLKTGKQDVLTAGDNITIEKDSSGNIVISATGGGGTSDITASGDNVFTGYNTFSNSGTQFGDSGSTTTLNIGSAYVKYDANEERMVLYGEGSLYVSGTSLTFEDNSGTTYNLLSSGGGTGDVTAAGNNTFTGSNTFNGDTYFNTTVNSSTTIKATSSFQCLKIIDDGIYQSSLRIFTGPGTASLALYAADASSSYCGIHMNANNQEITINGKDSTPLVVGYNSLTYTKSDGTVVDLLSGGGSSVTVDTELSTTSTNPVQNSVIATNINEMDTAIQTNAADIATLQSTITTLQSTIEALTTRIAALEAEIDGGDSTGTDTSTSST